jgi:hypothetical protein
MKKGFAFFHILVEFAASNCYDGKNF